MKKLFSASFPVTLNKFSEENICKKFNKRTMQGWNGWCIVSMTI